MYTKIGNIKYVYNDYSIIFGSDKYLKYNLSILLPFLLYFAII